MLVTTVQKKKEEKRLKTRQNKMWQLAFTNLRAERF